MRARGRKEMTGKQEIGERGTVNGSDTLVDSGKYQSGE
jgi:hypothetical protein